DPTRRHAVESPARLPRPPVKRRFEEVGELFAAGQSVEEIQKLYDVQRSTVLNHLVTYQAAGHDFDPARILALSQLEPDLRRTVLRRLSASPEMSLSPIHEEFGGLVPYEELHLLRLYLRCRRDQ